MVGYGRISRDIEFQMTGAAKRKEREPKLVLDVVVLARGVKGTNRLMTMKVRRNY